LVFGKFVSHRIRNMTLKIREGESRIQMHVQEGVENNALLRSLGSVPWVSGRLDQMQQDMGRDVIRRTRFSVISRFAFASAFGLGYLLAFVWGGIGLRNGTITFGIMTSFLQLVSQIQGPIHSLLNNAPQLIHATASIERLRELGDGAAAISETEPSAATQNMRGLRLQGVNFRYASSEKDILRDFNHDFTPGSKTAIVGETGAGKTSLFRLMLGLVEPQTGRVAVYSGDVAAAFGGDVVEKNVSADTSDCFVYVPQGNSLMSGSVRYNLLLAKPSATEDELHKVLQTACAEFVLDLPAGLDTELGERGLGLSEGQAQRIAVARGLLRPGNILLLDEISSALDESTERELFRRLFENFGDKTVILVTHRTAVATMCDAVVTLH
jgi:ABC-type multidrug transport system fused ATPase/permease subunit